MKKLVLCLLAMGCINTFATPEVQGAAAVGNVATLPVAGAQLADNSQQQPYGTPINNANGQGMGNDPSNAVPNQPTNPAPNGAQVQPAVAGANPLDNGQAFGANPNQPDPNDPSYQQQMADQNQNQEDNQPCQGRPQNACSGKCHWYYGTNQYCAN